VVEASRLNVSVDDLEPAFGPTPELHLAVQQILVGRICSTTWARKFKVHLICVVLEAVEWIDHQERQDSFRLALMFRSPVLWR
jgi:hypothetical protein